jgi:pimeloyl-ACP methyl ester carboxylesterase
VAERMIEANGVELCTESFGDPTDSPVLLVMGIGGSMLWWEEGFCRNLADGGRFVIRYDHRDTGRSVTYKPGCPGYTGADLVGDAAGVLDAYEVSAAHVVGVSAGGARRSPGRSPVRGCFGLRTPATGSIEPIGRRSAAGSSSTPPQPIGRADDDRF